MIAIQKEIVFFYLDELREGGETNMFGAGSYIVEKFRINEKKARQLLGEWMRTFNERHPTGGDR